MDTIYFGEPPKMIFHCKVARRKTFKWPQGEFDCLIAVLVEKGRFKFTINGVTDEASKNDIVFFPPNVHFKRTIYESLEFHNIGFCVPEPNTGWDKLCGKYTFEDKLRIESTIKMLSRLAATNEVETSSEEQSHLTSDLLYQLAIEQKFKQNDEDRCNDAIINEICSVLRSNMSSKVDFELLAKDYGMTQVQFIRRFSKAMGITPGKYLAQQRLKLAYSLLSSGAITVAETAKLCGFDSPFYLSECFKKQYGITPTQAKSGEKATRTSNGNVAK